jgi:hypothetical protein
MIWDFLTLKTLANVASSSKQDVKVMPIGHDFRDNCYLGMWNKVGEKIHTHKG